MDGTMCDFVTAGTGFCGCDFELSSQFGIRVCLFHHLEHSDDGKTHFLPSFTALILKDPTDVEMSIDVKNKGEDAMGSTATLSVYTNTCSFMTSANNSSINAFPSQKFSFDHLYLLHI